MPVTTNLDPQISGIPFATGMVWLRPRPEHEGRETSERIVIPPIVHSMSTLAASRVECPERLVYTPSYTADAGVPVPKHRPLKRQLPCKQPRFRGSFYFSGKGFQKVSIAPLPRFQSQAMICRRKLQIRGFKNMRKVSRLPSAEI